ncbi:hypothetical protein BZA77DRAFT_355656 [Pyronema omphalodes]|nr:hypothetical protein BZA77DRAFT_355656 [Pyronema omphalodes]
MYSGAGPPPARHQIISLSTFLHQLHRENTHLSASIEELRDDTFNLEREKEKLLLQTKMHQIEQEKEQFMQRRSTFIPRPSTNFTTPRKPRFTELQRFKFSDDEASAAAAAAAEKQRKRTILRSPEAPTFGVAVPPPVPKLPDLSAYDPGARFLLPPSGLPTRPATAPLPQQPVHNQEFPNIADPSAFEDMSPMPDTPARIRHQSMDKIRQLRFTEDTKPATDYRKPKTRRNTHGDGKKVIMKEFNFNAEIEEMMVDIQKWCEEAAYDEAEFEGVGVAI